MPLYAQQISGVCAEYLFFGLSGEIQGSDDLDIAFNVTPGRIGGEEDLILAVAIDDLHDRVLAEKTKNVCGVEINVITAKDIAHVVAHLASAHVSQYQFGVLYLSNDSSGSVRGAFYT